ncbi:type IV pilin-like G/H family protein [Kamptonema formosum]|uniref:type IV pilin-like G/H family protein n=1 Tax=Kamptonema formosum TaxID=331992 RepID=UPI0003740DE4|nr:type IV pilin-like G/H family protein [Oscillatoria sp. PCC 10802]
MKKSLLHRHLRLPAFAASLYLSLLGSLGAPVLAQPSAAPAAPQAQPSAAPAAPPSQPAAPSSPAVKQLLGQWEAKDPSGQRLLTFIFAPGGKLFIVLPSPEEPSPAVEMGYQINDAPKPMHLDVKINSDETVLTIVEITPDGKMRLQLEGTNPGLPRPAAFTQGGTLFEKISDATTLPKNAQLVEMKKTRAPESEGEVIIDVMTRAQQAYYVENSKFATKFEDLGIGIPSETDQYRYQILAESDRAQSVKVTAQAKADGLTSYTGAVFVRKNNGEEITVRVICQTNSPSTSPPAMPAPPESGATDSLCPAGSKPLP